MKVEFIYKMIPSYFPLVFLTLKWDLFSVVLFRSFYRDDEFIRSGLVTMPTAFT